MVLTYGIPLEFRGGVSLFSTDTIERLINLHFSSLPLPSWGRVSSKDYVLMNIHGVDDQGHIIVPCPVLQTVSAVHKSSRTDPPHVDEK